MEISFKNNSRELTIPTLARASKPTDVYIRDRCSLTIKAKKKEVSLARLFEETK